MPLYEVTLTQSYQNQQCVNRWNYLGTGTPAAVSMSFALAAAFGAIYDEVHIPPQYPTGTILDALIYIQHSGVSSQQLTVINPYSPTDFYQTPFVNPYNGLGSGDGLSPAVAIGFRSTQVRRDIARGTKRFVGVFESETGAGGLVDVSGGSRVNDVADRMTTPLTYDDEGNTLTFAPCIVGKERYNPETHLADPAGTAYRYYPVEADQLAKLAVGIIWQGYDHTRTQVSRQYGHGR
jgi:hypothetical protein